MRHFVRYAIARVEKSARDMAFSVYMAEALRLLGESTATGFGKGGYLKARYHELIDLKPVETRTGAEISEMMISKLKELGANEFA